MNGIKHAILIDDVRSMLEELTRRINGRCDLDFSVNRKMVQHILTSELCVAEQALTEMMIMPYIHGTYNVEITDDEIDETIIEVFGNRED